MKLFMPNKSILIVNAISVMVAFLIHLPEMIALSDMMPDEVIFPGMHWTDVFNEVFFTYLSLLLLFFLNERLFRFGDTQVNMGWKKLLLSFLVTWIASNLLGKGFVALHQHFVHGDLGSLVGETVQSHGIANPADGFHADVGS